MSLLVTGILFFAGRELIMPSTHAIALRKPAPATGSATEATRPYLAAHTPPAPLAALPSSTIASSPVHRNSAAANAPAEAQDVAAYKGISITLSHPVMDPSDLSGWVNRVQLPDHAPDLDVVAARPAAGEGGRTPEEATKTGTRPGSETASLHESAEGAREPAEDVDADGLTARSVLESLGAKGAGAARNRVRGHLAKNNAGGNGIEADALRPDSTIGSAKASATTIAEAQDRQRINWLHDYALNTLPAPGKRGRTYFQLTLAPTINYRSISGVDPSYEKWGPLTGFSVSSSKLLNLTPAFGFEFGGSILYRLTRNLSIKGGLQFNFARYQMTAYTIADSTYPHGANLNSLLGVIVHSLARGAGTTQQQSSGAANNIQVSSQNLDNDYFQISAPVGFELRVLGNERLQFNLGATIQPSYLLGTTSYMLTQDMMKYSKNPNYFRKWNISGGVEAFLSYRMGNIRWQIGPEFHYQVLSTYISQYPFNENLKTYGLKIGLTKMLP